MTNLEAIKAKVTYPLKDNSFSLALINRGLNSVEAYSAANIKALELAQADLLLVVACSPNISEGGYSVSLSERKTLRLLASGLYKKWGVKDPEASTAQFINPW